MVFKLFRPPSQASSHPIQPYHDYSRSESAGGSTINNELDVETAALIAKLAHDDLAKVVNSCKGKGRADSLPDDAIAYRLQIEQYYEWLSIVADAQLASCIDGTLVTDNAYLDGFSAEEVEAGDWIVAELLSRDEGCSVYV